VEKQYLYFRRLPIPQTGALAAAESGLRLLTQAAIEKRSFVQFPPYPARSSNQQSSPSEFARLKHVAVIPITPPR
ncbi:hypothetical protein, partial [Sphingomonas sp. PP-CC-3G-468]|uniref:hypothetical protein n=1 Tax=Sphingomonas sp. PP-CC-3G-468 TaxID=2135656 RepID=UPI001A9F6EFF